MTPNFQQTLRDALNQFLLDQQRRFPSEEILKIDLHCHDFNSDVPDELIGRILNVPETWLSSQKLLEELNKNRCDTYTITNHNNARSCYALQDKGYDILTAAEFSCMVPDFGIGIHVLTYGFTPEQEVKLNKLRKNIYPFLEYAHEQQIPTIWAHPLFHYTARESPPEAFFNKMLLVFERFEVLNGQRDSWQNILVAEWLRQTTPADIDRYAGDFGIDPFRFCSDPYRKSMSGGSDCHTGIFAGMTGTYLHIPALEQRLKTESRSSLALEAIRKGEMAPYGTYQNAEKMTIAFLDYACQIALNYKDAGLVRLLLHKGSASEKLISFIVSNLFCEVQRHKVTTSFIRIFHESMMGERPSFLQKMTLKPIYQPVFDETIHIAQKHKQTGHSLIDGYYRSILMMNRQLYVILTKRLEKKLHKADIAAYLKGDSFNTLMERLELPGNIRAYLQTDDKRPKNTFDLSEFLDGLSFPFFGTLFILSAHFAGAKAMYHTRSLLRDFSGRLGRFEHPKRVLWLTDTFGEKNGISVFLKAMHAEIKTRKLPIDIVTCSSILQADENLVVLHPVKEFSLPLYNDYTFKIPDFVQLHNLFVSGEYDRIICSTEGIMGLCALYLKHAYTVEASFYMHTDWLMFARKALGIEGHHLNRLRRMLRTFYQAFDHIFVLNSDQKAWLSGTQMNIASEKVHQTAHWIDRSFQPAFPDKKKHFGLTDENPVLLYVGRLSKEKGVLELTSIYEQVKQKNEFVRLVVVGEGPVLEQLQEENPDAVFMGWIGQERLPEIYSSADLLVLPSRFDTFCNVVLESLSCGLPVIAYNAKGPKDIIRNGIDGFLVNNKQEMPESILAFLNSDSKATFRSSALERAKSYQPEAIINDLMQSVGLTQVTAPSKFSSKPLEPIFPDSQLPG
ncbi:MAG: glycosyltransferase [Dysgonamonadaceae bacterium]|jgi:glycosyltransferase involved in cell wall biosynthesis|nr:glycosyltransferase [Dysgonamonadaceae bacterium]